MLVQANFPKSNSKMFSLNKLKVMKKSAIMGAK